MNDDLEPGSVWVIEKQLAGKFYKGGGVDPGDAQAQYGTVPTELWPEDFDAIRQATAYGVTVIAGSGNGQMNLDDPNLYSGPEWAFAHNLSKEDAGSIMVGASQGANEQVASWSNCGKRVNSFAWGQGVVTTAYPYGAYDWYGKNQPRPVNAKNDPNNFYMDVFGGTSSAAAMVGGAAALIQSHARGSLAHKRYIMPAKMREIIVGSGVPQKNGGCNIGKQPRIDVALTLADALLTEARQRYPELVNDAPRLTGQRMIDLRKLGVGIICHKADAREHKLVGFNDPICPEEELWPAGNYIAKDYDFDGDARADLVQWTNGTWKLDLSSEGVDGDNFGAWDVVVNHAPIFGKWVWPYVADMNSDGREDFVVYDKEHGKFYVALTNETLLAGNWRGWDWTLDYSAEWRDDLKLDPWKSNYSRPAIGDYDGDGWVDIAIACSDGEWRIDYGARSPADGDDQSVFAGFDRNVKYLSEEQLTAAPGWGYLVVDDNNNGYKINTVMYKIPDGLPDEGRLVSLSRPDYAKDWFEYRKVPHIFGGNDSIVLSGVFRDGIGIGMKMGDGSWPIAYQDRNTSNFPAMQPVSPPDIYGDKRCHPLLGDFDGDIYEDRAVMCPDEWRIAYSSADLFMQDRSPDNARHVQLGYDKSKFSLPGRSYSGGISYSYTKQLIEFFQDANPYIPPPIPVDMITTDRCLPWQC